MSQTVVTIDVGGTGANTAAGALISLGAAPAISFDQSNTAVVTANIANAQATTANTQANFARAQANAAFNAANNRVLKAGDTMTGNLNVAATLITQNVIPDANITYDLGTSTARFKDLWLSNSTIHLGEATISSNGSKLVVPAMETTTGMNLEAEIVSVSNSANNRVLKAGDTMTGQLNISSGGLLVTGNVGIGTTNPLNRLDVIGTITSRSAILNDAANPKEGLRFTWESDGGDTTYRNSIFNGIANGPNAGIMQFRVNDNVSSQKAVMSLLGSGNVGIGTVNPITILHLESDGSAGSFVEQFRVRSGPDNNDTGSSIGIFQKDNSRGLIIRAGRGSGDQAKADFVLNRSGLNIPSGTQDVIMTFLQGGNVGIGTTNPSNRVHITTSGLDIVDSNAINGSTMAGIRLHNTLNDNSSLGIWFGTNDVHWAGISGQRSNFAATWGTDLRFYTHEDETVDLTYARERFRIASTGALERFAPVWNGGPDSYSAGQAVAQTQATALERHAAFAWKDLGRIGTRAYMDYVDFKTNIYSDNIMFMFYFVGYQYSAGVSSYYGGGYTYLGDVIAKATGTGYQVVGGDYVYNFYRASDGALCVKLYIGNQGYNEGVTHVFFNAHNNDITRDCRIIASAVYNSTSNYY
jgi:hypothetical protein